MLSVSRDKQWILSSVPTEPVQLMMYPVGAGASRRLDHAEFKAITQAELIDEGKQVIVCGTEPKRALRCYVGATDDRASSGASALRAITPEGVSAAVVAPDGQFVVASAADGTITRYGVRDGAATAITGVTSKDVVLRYSPDGRALWVMRADALPVRLERVDLATGVRTFLPVLPFAGRRSGVLYVSWVTLADNPKNFAWIEREVVSDVFEVKGLK